jgi:Xaa-Pro aminopeptidase
MDSREATVAIFSESELGAREQRAREALDRAGVEAVLATSYPAFYHLTGAPLYPFGRPMVALLPLSGDPAVICSVIERGHVELQTHIRDLRLYWDNGDGPTPSTPAAPPASLVRLLAGTVRERGLEAARIGYEDATLPVRLFEAVRSALPRVTFVPASDLIDRLRFVKSAEELAILRAADAIADLGQEALIGHLAAGARAADLHRDVEGVMRDAVLDRHPDAAFRLRVGVGLGSPAKGAGHSEWTTWGPHDAAREGDILETVVDAILWGYTGNVERAVVVGRPSDRIRHDFGVMVEANERAIAAVRPGVGLAEIDRVCKDVFARHGFSTRTGSGVGRGTISYEGNHRELLMDVRLYSETVLESGMAFSIEPDLQTEDGTYRHCNTIIVTADGCEVDSRIDRGVIWV